MSSSGSRNRLLIVRVISAAMDKKYKGLFYVKLWLRPSDQLETRCIYHDGLIHIAWNQSFVFAIPETALADGKSFVKIQMFRKNRFFSDSLVGELDVKLDGFKSDKEIRILDDIDDFKYNSVDDLSHSEDEEEKERKREKREGYPELKKRVSIEMKKTMLKVELVISKMILNQVGKGSDCPGLAMDYEEFQGNRQYDLEVKKNIISVFLMCLKP